MTLFARALSLPRVEWVRHIRAYWALIKSLQTGLLLLTGIAGFVSARVPFTWQSLLAFSGSLFMAISGSTILNMVNDADIDAKMKRTAKRPLPTGLVAKGEALRIGTALALLGCGWALTLEPLYGSVVLAGLFFDVVVYTLWLKRRTPWSIIWGGISGGMPILAGRVLGIGLIDPVGLLLALGVLLWIPTHIMTFSLKNAEDYCLAGVPVFPNTHGPETTRSIISLSTVGAVIVMLCAEWQIGIASALWYAALALGLALLGLTCLGMSRPYTSLTHALYKFASLYMLGSMLFIIIGVH